MGKVKYLIFVLFVGILFLCPDFIFAQVASEEAEIILVKGDVKIQRAGKVEWIDAKKGMRLSDGDTAKTGKASSLEIAFDKENKNVARLGENTTAILRGKLLRQIELPQGRVRFLIRKLKKDSSFEIRTPSAVAGMRGTGGDVLSEANRDEIKAHEDELYVQTFDEEGNLIEEVIITEGWETIIDRFEGPSELIELTDRDREDWNSWKEDLSERTGAEREERGAEQFSGAEQATETAQEQSDYKEQIFETEEIDRIEDRAGGEETGGGCTSPPYP